MKALALNVAAVAATAAAVAAGTLYHRDASRARALPADNQPQVVKDWRVYASQGVRMGPPSARVTVVEFADFRCPHCARAALTLRELRRLFPGDVALVYRHFPLSRPSRTAALAAECGSRTGFFEALHDRFYAEPDSLGVKPWTRFAWEAGIRDTSRFARCMEDSTVVSVLVDDLRAAEELDIRATPTLLVNDRLFTGSPGLRYLKDLVKRAMQEAEPE